jgi:hypothetical protein
MKHRPRAAKPDWAIHEERWKYGSGSIEWLDDQGLEHAMLAEKLLLVLESLIRNQGHNDGGPRVVSSSPHIPVKLPPGPKS